MGLVVHQSHRLEPWPRLLPRGRRQSAQAARQHGSAAEHHFVTGAAQCVGARLGAAAAHQDAGWPRPAAGWGHAHVYGLPLSRSTVNTVRPLSGHCQVILTVTTRVHCQDCQAGLCQAVRAVSHCHGMPTPAGRGPRRVLGGQDGSMWVRAGSQEGLACEGSMVVVLRGGPGSRFAC